MGASRAGTMRASKMTIRTVASAIAASLAAGLTTTALSISPAPAQSNAQVGTLSCDVSAGVGMILMQKQTMTCVFTLANGGPPEPYLGRIDEFGVPRGALSGTYGGVGAQASAGAGVGANVLVGGTGRAFSLQPVSVSGQTGLNIAAGVTTVTLTSVQ